MARETSHWLGYTPADWHPTFDAGARVLDVGCGQGGQLRRLVDMGTRPAGIDAWREPLAACRAHALPVAQARAEQLPFQDLTFDGIVCNVVLPYTDEHRVIREIGRILKSGGRGYIVSHAVGYYTRYLVAPPEWKLRVYAARALANSWVWALAGSRLPGFLGDTIYQSRGRLRRDYIAAGLVLEREVAGRTFMGLPVFFHHQVRKP